MQLTNVTNGDTFWAFSQANEVVGGEHVAHLWNYGANTWGWEDLAGGGDRDFNDLIVQLDFTSTAAKACSSPDLDSAGRCGSGSLVSVDWGGDPRTSFRLMRDAGH